MKMQFLNSPAAAAFTKLLIPGGMRNSEFQFPRLKIHCVNSLKQVLDALNPTGPILDALWIKYGRKRGFEFDPAGSDVSLSHAQDYLEKILQILK